MIVHLAILGYCLLLNFILIEAMEAANHQSSKYQDIEILESLSETTKQLLGLRLISMREVSKKTCHSLSQRRNLVTL